MTTRKRLSLRSSRTLAHSLGLSLGLALAAVGASPSAAQGRESTVAQLLSAPRFDRAAAERLYADAVLRNDVAALDRALDAAAAEGQPPAGRVRALLARATIAWQRGDADRAQGDADRAVALSPDRASFLLQAELRDARGDIASARTSYARALDLTPDAAERARIRLCIALLDDAPEAASLVRAAEGDASRRERYAIVAALAGRPRDALALSGANASGASTLADALRLSQWALADGRATIARDAAWRAYGLASDASDRRYALSLLIESFRAAGDLAGALAFLEPHRNRPEVAQTRIDLLLELGRTDAALAAVAGSDDPAMRSRLLEILDLAGRAGEGESEYRRLIAADPHRLEGYRALAMLQLGRGDRAGATATFRSFFSANPGQADLLIAGARQMIAMDLTDAAMDLMRDASSAPGMAVPYRFFLVDAYRQRGDDAAALSQLDALRTRLPAGARDRIAVADAYEALGRKAAALDVLRALEATPPGLDYDQQVRVAMLAGENGQAQEALTRWRKLWNDAALPARKSYLAKQIVRTAQQLGAIDRLIGDLTRPGARLSEDELGLLVELRIATRDRVAAIADIERHARSIGASEADRLRRQVAIYARLDDHRRVDATLRRLVAVDPARAELYLRQLTLNAVRFAPDGETTAAQLARIDALLSDLRAASGFDPLEATRFTAAVYASAGFTARAVDAYRRAAALAGNDMESRVQLSDLLRKQDAPGEAASLLQYAALHATGQADFTAAIDALVAVLSPEPDGPPPLPGLARLAATRLAWAQRRIFERIVESGEDARLYALIADLAQAQGDFAFQLRAYANALPVAGDQRAAVLRMLVTLASGGASVTNGGTGPALGDTQAKLTFGRRLLALKRDYPPDVYTDLAATLLAVGDQAGAERAFAMMGDGAGLVDVDRAKGDSYAAQGYIDAALRNYDRARLRDRQDPELVLRGSILREQKGDRAAAFADYWDALAALALRQPLRGPGSEAASLDARQYLATLIEGLMLSWPDDPAAAVRVQSGFTALFDPAVGAIAPDAGQPLDGYARLALLTALGRRIADRSDDRALAERIEQRLTPLLARDEVARRAALAFRGRMGWVDAPVTGPDWTIKALATQAEGDGNRELAQSIALASGDAAAIRREIALAMATEAANEQAIRTGQARPALESPLFAMLLKGVALLPPDTFRSLILAPIEATPYRTRILLDAYRSGAGWYERIERAAGRPLLTDEALLTLLTEGGNGPVPLTRLTALTRRSESASPAALVERFPVAARLALYERLVARMQAQGQETAYQEALVGQLLAAPLDAGQQARLESAMLADIGFDRGLKNRAATFVVQKLLVPDTDRGNRALLLRVARAAAARHAAARHLPEFLDALFAGDNVRAYRELRALHADTSAQYQGIDYAAPIVRQRFAAERRAEIDRFLALDRADAGVTAAFYRDFVVPARSSTVAAERAEQPGFYRKLAALESDNPTYVAGALDAMWNGGDRAGFVALLAHYHAAHRDDREAASVLQLAYRLTGDATAASAVAAASGADVRNDSWLVEMVNRASAARAGAVEPDFRGLFALLYPAYAQAAATDPAVIEAERRRSLAQQQQPDAARVGPLRNVIDAIPRGAQAVRDALRGRWRATAPRQDGDGVVGADRMQLLRELPDPDAPTPRDAALLDLLLTPVLTDELQGWLRGIDPAQRPYQARIDALIAAGLIKQGQASARIASGLAALAAGTIRPDALHQLAVLMARSDTPLPADAAPALARRLATIPALSTADRIRYARLFATAGDTDRAAGLLDAALLQTLYPSSFEAIEGVDASEQLAAMVAELRRWPDRAAARAIHARLAQRITRELGPDAQDSPTARLPSLDAAP